MNKPVFHPDCSRTIRVIESHTSGEPTRIVYDGFPPAPGTTIMEKKLFLEKNFDNLQSAILCEPRGHKDMVGAVLLDPVNASSDLGVIFMDAYRWINMCGHASMGVAYAAVETGIVPSRGKVTNVVLDTPAGTVTVSVDTSTNECVLYNVPSYLALPNCLVKIDDMGVNFSVAYGGTFFAIIDLNSIGKTLAGIDILNLVDFTKHFLKAANEKYSVKHPFENISRIVNVEYFEKTEDHGHYRNIVISEQGEIDRSPCGTGTSAELAALFGKGQIKESEVLNNTNFLGSTFLASISESKNIGPYSGIVPKITGKVFIIGKSDFYLSDKDPCNNGFNIF